MAHLVSLSGLPGVGKTTIARHLCRLTSAVHLRVDTIETSLKQGPLQVQTVDGAGYMIAAGIAIDNLRLGLDVVADTVNPVSVSRQIWRQAADDAQAELVDVEIICSDAVEHRRRVEARSADIPGHVLPSWSDVVNRDFEAWPSPVFRVDTCDASPAICAEQIARHLHALDRSKSSSGTSG